jgi:hypothetical protein
VKTGIMLKHPIHVFIFLDIEKKAANAEELRNLYENREIKFSSKYHSL